MQAVLSLVHSYEDDEVIPITEIATSRDIPETFLRKLLRSLINAGVVESKRGYWGGIRLAKPPADITVLEVVEAVEGEVGLSRCVKDPSHCELGKECPMYIVWREATDLLRNQLEGYTLEQIHHRALALESQELASSQKSL